MKKDRIYKIVRTSENRAYFRPYNVAALIKPNLEFQAKNMLEISLDGQNIKAVCWKLEVDRLGNIVKIIK